MTQDPMTALKLTDPARYIPDDGDAVKRRKQSPLCRGSRRYH